MNISEQQINEALIKAESEKFRFSRIEIGKDTVSRFLMCCLPASSPAHRHPEWELISLLRGRLDITLYSDDMAEKERFILESEASVVTEIPANVIHRVTALTKSVFLEVKPGETLPKFFM